MTTNATPEERTRMAELSTYDFDWHPPGWESIDRPDVFAWHWPGDWHAYSRGVARATFNDADLENRIAELRAFFQRHERTARWHVGPSTRSHALRAFLRDRAGAVHEPRLMTGPIEGLRFRANAAVRVEPLNSAEVAREWMRACFPDLAPRQLEIDVARWDQRRSSSGPRSGELVAYLGEELAGWAAWRDSTDGWAVQFVGGWTRPDLRGRGVYSTLCEFRAARAHERGRRYATIVADPTTSAPIVANAGFSDHGPELVFTDVEL